MVSISKANSYVARLIGKQKIAMSDYRKLQHLLCRKVPDGLLVYNCLTGELILFNCEEMCEFETGKFSSEQLRAALIEKWFLVEQNHDDNALCDKVNEIMFALRDRNTNTPIVHYTIFTTTDCNARCFYCFEAHRKHITMTAQTARDTVDFIERSAAGNPITIRWFGGEPLYNSEVIDLICKGLRQKGVSYTSTMVSNGYLFDGEVVFKAKKLWNLKSVKIAVDGTEEVYNRCKAYIYKQGNPFKRVMDNIETLLKAEISVVVRMNMDTHNSKDLYQLSDEIYTRFKAYDNLSFDLHLLLENSTSKQINRTDIDRHNLMEEYSSLKAYINSLIQPKSYKLENVRRWRQCMADDDASTTILPDGSLGKCDYYTDTGFWGSIYSNNIDKSAIAEFKRMVRPNGGERCDDCPVRPLCYQLEKCCDRVDRCDEFDRDLKVKSMLNLIYDTYLQG